MGTPLPLPKKWGRAPKFSAHVYCGQMATWIEMVLGMEVGLSPGDFVLDASQPPPQKGAEPPPHFSAHVCCGQTAGWIKMPLGLEVGLGLDNIVLDGDPAPPPKKGAEPPPQFSAHVCCGQTAGWIKMAHGMEVGLGSGHIVLDMDPAPLPKKGGRAPSFQPIFGRPFVKRFALCYRSVVCPVCTVCLSLLSVTFVHCGQTVGPIKMKIGMQVGLGPGHTVLGGDRAPVP